MTPLPPKPAFNAAKPALYFVHAAKYFNALRRAKNHDGAAMFSTAHSVGFVANGDMETAFNIGAVGDHGTAYSIAQWHWHPRGEQILAATGIDVRVETDFDKIVAAIVWELIGADGKRGVEAHAWAEISACNTSASSAAAICTYFEGAGAAEAEERRMADANYWVVFFANNAAWVEAQG